MPEQGRRSGDKMERFAKQRQRNPARPCCFAGIQQQGQRGERLIASSQHIGRADIAGPNLPYIRPARQAGEEKAEGNGAQQVTEGDAKGDGHNAGLPEAARGVKAGSNTMITKGAEE